MKLNQKKIRIIICTSIASLITSFAFSQIGGSISDEENNPLAGASVVIKGTTIGSTTDFNGVFSIDAKQGDILVISYVGFKTKELTVESNEALNIKLEEGVVLDEVLITGNRNKPRTAVDSAVPIDNIRISEVLNVGEASIERALTFAIPSFNSQDQPISDATAGFSPADIRGLGPSRTLVLINGKRVNQQSQAYLNRTPGKGEVGVNLKSIPIAAVERIEVLRDGASSQYGSDAMAGVLNFILKRDSAFSTFNAGTGITSAGDGYQFNLDYNTTFPFGDGGRINLTLAYTDQEKTNRAGSPGIESGDTNENSPQHVLDFVNDNPSLGMIVGRPDLNQKNIFVNITHPLGENSEFYTTHGFSDRWNRSFAYYRHPAWRSDVDASNFLTPAGEFQGYHPTFEGSIQDYFNLIGAKFDLNNEWYLDVSVTHGKNSIDYTVNNSLNRDYLRDHEWSPTSFKPGGYAFSNVIENLDLTKTFNEKIAFSAGLEYKQEKFEAFKGDFFSRYGGGSDSFAGISTEQEGEWTRNNIALYTGVDIDFTDELLLSTAMRYENFSDVGSNFSWKAASRYRLAENLVIRGSISTGFRAPSLHQLNLSNTIFIIVEGSNEPLLQGTIRNGSEQVRSLGIKDLFPETSTNITAGIAFGDGNKFSGSLDVYNIDVNDRVLFTSQIKGSEGSQLEQDLLAAGVVSVQAWVNAGNTNTKGVDFILNWKNKNLNLGLNGNLNTTKIDKIDTPSELEGVEIFSHREQSLITNSRPKSKFSFTVDYALEKLEFGMYNTYFGEVTVANVNENPELDQVMAGKLITDFRLTYLFTPQLKLTGIINNLFDVYPDILLDQTGNQGGRFLYSREVSQHGQLGRNYSLNLSYKF